MKTFSSFSSVFFAFDNFDFVEHTVTVSMENHAADSVRNTSACKQPESRIAKGHSIN